MFPQSDTFYRVPAGRLKLRREGPGAGELNFYERPDVGGPKMSSYFVTSVSDPTALDLVLAAALGRAGEVVKTRELSLVGRTRIHLDDVTGLGLFIEIEVVLARDDDPSAGEREAWSLIQRLGIASTDLVATAYVDLLTARTNC